VNGPNGCGQMRVGQCCDPARRFIACGLEVRTQGVNEHQPENIVAGRSRTRQSTAPFDIKLIEQPGELRRGAALRLDHQDVGQQVQHRRCIA